MSLIAFIKSGVRILLKRLGILASSLACCCSSGGFVAICCCPNAIKRRIVWTFASNGTGSLVCLNGVSITLVYDPTASSLCGSPSGQIDVWVAEGLPISYCTGNCTFTTFELYCTCQNGCGPGGTWATLISSAEASPCLNELGAPTTTQCEPFQLCGTVMESTTGDTIDYCVVEE